MKRLALFCLLAVALLSFGCGPSVVEYLEKRTDQQYSATQGIEVFFLTSRAVNPGSQVACSNAYFLNFGNHTQKTGSCLVSVPADREVGALPFGLGNKDKSFQFLEHKIGNQSLNPAEQESLWWKRIEEDPFEEVIIFVHGFNVNFEEAVLRAAQLKYDLKFPGKVALYSWPAGTDGSMLGSLFLKNTYEKNLTSARSSRDSFKGFIRRMSQTKKKIHLLVHSMGHQVVLNSIAELSKETGSQPFLKELVLNAPDYDTGEFILILQSLLRSSERITLYCSPGDSALFASAQIHQAGRLGACSRFPGVDVVNVNPIDSSLLSLGHGYYSSRPVITDLYQLFLGLHAEKRLFIRRSYGNENYILRN
ncbi:alpha/beta hydrolase [Leptospira langatensis]|uniref:Alpha/beta hydrolase n=1 Tax=Leptospira langatensis TaxID=2484983 RepID=A0A5F1ZRS9_9LEPT|nr:alpha/beta hydrolase [Leptospira langatensis]TGK02586.1 alpha/beta hydrolase [Leptospira langatensis]TGL40213.1 alpha/beta hydrolase [Leptospira langatensis]